MMPLVAICLIPMYRGRIIRAMCATYLAITGTVIIAHPECTRLTNAGVRWLHERQLWQELDGACDFFNLFLDHPCKKIVIENPVPHKYAVERLRRNYDPTIQPYHHGHMESKRTCLWLKGVDPLRPTNNVEVEMRKLPYAERNKIHYATPGPDRWKIRSKTFSGIADAFGDQWG